MVDVLQLMDALSPGSNFSNRRNDCAKKMRVKLRAFARKEEHQNHPGSEQRTGGLQIKLR
jgi:hypothetical protein